MRKVDLRQLISRQLRGAESLTVPLQEREFIGTGIYMLHNIPGTFSPSESIEYTICRLGTRR